MCADKPYVVEVEGLPASRWATSDDAEKCAATWVALGEKPVITHDPAHTAD